MQLMARLLNAPSIVFTACVLNGLVACSSNPPAVEGPPPSAGIDGTHIHSGRSLLAAARVQRHAGNTPEAERLLNNLLSQRPSYTGGHVELASMQLEVGNLMGARQALDAGLAQAPNNLDLVRLDGAYYLASGDLMGAYTRYSHVAEESPQSPQAARNLALVLVLQDKTEDAEEALSLHLDSERADAVLRAMLILRARSLEQPAWKTRAPKAEPETLTDAPLSMIEPPLPAPEPGMQALPVKAEVTGGSGTPILKPVMEMPVEQPAEVPAEPPA